MAPRRPSPHLRRAPFAGACALLAALPALLLSGCAAVDIGAPSETSSKRTLWKTASMPSRTEVTAIHPVAKIEGRDRLTLGFQADIREEYPRSSRIETTTTVRQRRLSYGFFPAAAEQYAVPPGATGPDCLKHDYPASFLLGLPFVPFGTAYSLLWEGPFGSYDCSDGKNHNAFSHVGLLGVHKYTVTTRRRPVTGPERPESPDVKTRSAQWIPGPCEITVFIDELGYRNTQFLPRGDTSSSFPLPAVTRDRNVLARATLSPSPSDSVSSSAWRPLALRKAQGQSYSFNLFLKAPPPPPPPPPPKPVPVPQPAYRPVPSSSVVTQTVVIRERPVPVPQSQPKPLFDNIRKEYLPDGTTEIRVHVNDTSRTFDIDRQINPTIRGMFQQEFTDRNPLVPLHDVRVETRWTTDDTGAEMIYRGGAFSIRPEKVAGSRYDPDTRRGILRLRVAGTIPEDILRTYVRANISAIVSEKNILLEAGMAPPSGARYKSLGESYDDGILTIEFEADD